MNQVNTLKDQYLSLVRYYHQTIDLCESRVDELLGMLDRSSLDRLIEDVTIEKHLIVMSFNNVSKNEKFDELSSIFPDMIVNRYKSRDDVQVNYSGKIDPDLRKIPSFDNAVDKFLIDGEYLIDGYEIKVKFKVYKVNDWSLIKDAHIICDIRDLECIYDSFLWKLKNIVDPLIDYEKYDDFSETTKKVINKVRLDSIDQSLRNENLFTPLLEDFAVQKDYSFDIKYKDFSLDQTDAIKTQVFDLAKHPNGIVSRKDQQKNLLTKIESFFEDPYKIDIGELDMVLNPTDLSYVNLDVLISYNINKRDFEKTVKKMPYNVLKSTKTSNVFEFLNEDYLFENEFISVLNSHEKELFPVLFFTNKGGEIQKIIIDSWDNRYDRVLFGDYDVERQNNFTQMYSIINDNSDIQINLSNKKQVVNYKVVMPVSLLDNYTQLTVKVFTREKLDKYLPINELGF